MRLEPDTHRPGLWPVDSVEEAGPREVRLRLREPSSLLLEALSVLQAVPAGPYSTPDDEATEPEFQAISQPGQPTGQVKAIKVRRYDTARAAVAALLRDDVDVLYEVPPESRALLIGEEGVRVFPNVKPYVVTLGFNHKHPVLRKRDVRVAMNIAIDRRVLVAQVAGGIGVPAADMIWHQHWSRPHEDDLRAFPMDRQRAGQLLDDAGLPRRTATAGAIEPRFRVSCLVLDDPVIQRVAARLQQAYADVGIALDLQPAALAELGGLLATGQFDAFIAPVVSGYGMSMPYGLFGVAYRSADDHARLHRGRAGGRARARRGEPRGTARRSARSAPRADRRPAGGVSLLAGDQPRRRAARVRTRRHLWRHTERAGALVVQEPHAVIPITRRMALLVTTAALVPLLIFGLVAGRTLRTTTRDSVKENHAAIAARAAEAIELYLRSSERLVRSAGSDLIGTGLTRAQQNTVLLNQVTITPEIKLLTLYAADGTPVATSGLSPEPPPRLTQLSDASFTLLPVDVDDDGLPRARMKLRLDQALAPYLVAELQLEELWQVVDNVKVGMSGRAFLVDETGRIIADGRPNGKSRIARGARIGAHPLADGNRRG